MRKNFNALVTGCILPIMIVSLVSCGVKNTSTDVTNNDSLLNEKNAETSKEKAPTADTALSPKTDKSDSETVEQDSHVVITDLEPSDGLEFESNGDGTCSIKGIGVCTDKDIVIPTKSPDGNIVTSIAEYAFYGAEDIDSITLVNYNYEVDKFAFQYGEFTTLNIIGGSPLIEKSTFSSCEDLVSISFNDCNIEIGEYAFFGCEDLTSVSICENGKSDNNIKIDDRAFQYCKRLDSVMIGSGNITIGEYIFSGCSDNLAISISGNTYTANSIQKGLSQ